MASYEDELKEMLSRNRPIMIIHAHWIGEQAVLPRQDFERLLELARRSESVDLQSADDDVSTWAMMRLAEESGEFEFWNAPGEYIDSLEDGDPV